MKQTLMKDSLNISNVQKCEMLFSDISNVKYEHTISEKSENLLWINLIY